MTIYFKHLPHAVIERLFHLLDVVFKGKPTLAECRELVEGINVELQQERVCLGNLLMSNNDLRNELNKVRDENDELRGKLDSERLVHQERVDAMGTHISRLTQEVREMGTRLSIMRALKSGAQLELDAAQRRLDAMHDAEQRANHFLQMEAAHAVALRDALDKAKHLSEELHDARGAAQHYATLFAARDKEISEMVAAYHRYGHELKKIAYEHANEDE